MVVLGFVLTIEYRHLNAVTKKDAYPLPNITDCMDTHMRAFENCCLFKIGDTK